MKFIGVKLTHDGAVAVIENGRLLRSIEIEKLNNNPRYSAFPGENIHEALIDVQAICESAGILIENGDAIVIDGWRNGEIKSHGLTGLGRYHENDRPAVKKPSPDSLSAARFVGEHQLPNGTKVSILSTHHAAGHVIGSYAMWDGSKLGRSAHVLVWDGGMRPMLYAVDPTASEPVRYVATAHNLHGVIYGIMRYYFGPFKDERVIHDFKPTRGEPKHLGGREYPGKMMAWIGKANHEFSSPIKKIVKHFARREKPFYGEYDMDGVLEHETLRAVHRFAIENGISDAVAAHSVHDALGDLLINFLAEELPIGSPLIFTGGCALNIDWNSRLRNHVSVSEFFVPPTPNDSGSAIGAAATAMAARTGHYSLNWSVFSGPSMRPGFEQDRDGWREVECKEFIDRWIGSKDLGGIVLALNGRSEIGPRALGARSLFAFPQSPASKTELNRVKGREDWRPVAPLWVLNDSRPNFHLVSDYFDIESSDDPFMLFSYRMTRKGAISLPAVLHIDGTARLQVMRSGSPHWHSFIGEFLLAVARAENLPPVFCNTSANLNGSGFFNDEKTALTWAREKGIKLALIKGAYLVAKD